MSGVTFRGIENVDPEELEKQRALTVALWEQLEDQGWRSGTPARIECYFFAPNADAASSLGAKFSDWEPEIAQSDEDKKLVRLTTQPVHLTRDALLELVDVLVIAANEEACRFDGFQVETTSITRKKPWWKLW